MRTLWPLADSALQLFFPQRCVFCGEVTTGGERCCSRCDRLLRRRGGETRLMLDGTPVYSCFYYKDRARQRLTDLKFHGKEELAEYFAVQMSNLLKEEMGERTFDLVVYPPMPELRQEGRGYNQAELLARDIAAGLEIPCGLCGLGRDGAFAQHDLHLSMRKKQQDCGYFMTPGQTAPERLLLVDDVCTSGTSLRCCIRLLQGAGAREIAAVTLCR